MGDIVGNVTDLHLRNIFAVEQAVAHVFGQLAERPNVGIPIEANRHYFLLVRLQPYFGLLNIVGEGVDAVYRLIDVLEGFHAVGTGHQFNGYAAGTFVGG